MARAKKPEEAKKGAPEWMNTYGDLVTLLLCFFVLLFSMSSVDIAKFKAMISSFEDNIGLMPGGQSIAEGQLISNGISQLDGIAMYFDKKTSGEQPPEVPKDEVTQENKNPNKEVAEQISKYFNSNKIGDKVEVTSTEQYILLSLKGSTLFDSGRANIKDDSIKLLNIISNILKQYKQYSLAIEGHTDNRPIRTSEFPSNMYLSSARAIQVYEFLLGKGFDANKMFAVGYGEYRPIMSNDTEAGRAKNRRVEIKVVRPVDSIK